MNDDVLHVARAAVVREHMASEDHHELDTTIQTFSQAASASPSKNGNT